MRRQFETNVFGLVRLTQLVLPKMRAQRWGKIVNVGSMGGRLSFPGGGHYHATKHALEAISDALRFELRGFGIDVILLEPGLITTEFGEAATASMAGVERRGADDPYANFNATVGAVTKGAYEGPMRLLGGGPDRVAKVIERAIARRRAACADHDHALGEAHDRDAAPAQRPRVGRGDAQAVPPAQIARGSDARRAAQRGVRAAHLEALGVVHAVARAAARIVASSPTNSAIVRLPMPRATPTSALTTSWSLRRAGRPRMKSPSIFR